MTLDGSPEAPTNEPVAPHPPVGLGAEEVDVILGELVCRTA